MADAFDASGQHMQEEAAYKLCTAQELFALATLGVGTHRVIPRLYVAGAASFAPALAQDGGQSPDAVRSTGPRRALLLWHQQPRLGSP
jgi:hypothetical protein